MLMADIRLFFLMLLLHAISFLALHFIVLWFATRIDPLVSLAATSMASIIFVSLLSYYLFSSRFSTFDSFAVSMLGTAFASFFGSLLYSFLGPLTADRSLGSHLITLLAKIDTGCSFDEISRHFESKLFIEKRIDEYLKAKIIVDKGGVLF